MSARKHMDHDASDGFRADVRGFLRELNKHTSAGHKRAVLLLLLVGVILRAALLTGPIGYDEAFAYVQFATLPAGKLIGHLSHPANQIFHTLLTKWSTELFGLGPIQLRLPAFLSGVLVLPLFYFFVRAMFNRYIALLSLAFVVASGPLVEYSAMARGYSLTWLCMMLAFVLGRHLIKTNSMTSAALIGVTCAFGLWTLPSMIFVVIMVYIWLLFSLTTRYEHSLRPRMNLLLLSIGVFMLLTVMLYLPVIRAHGLDQIMHHPSVPYLNWRQFRRKHDAMSFDLWAYLVDSTSVWLAILGLLGLVQAAFVSSKFRTLGFGLVLGAVPLVVFLRQIIPTLDWLYALFIFHLSSGIALFYLLKFVQEKLIPGFSKRIRTQLAAVVVLFIFGIPGMRMAMERTEGMPEAARTVTYAKSRLQPGDKLYAIYPWDAPIRFEAMVLGLDAGYLSGSPSPGATILVAFSPLNEQSVEDVLRHHEEDPAQWPGLHMVQDWPGLRIFAAP
ncbi:MAG: glycosyltransferase family 39 protein [Flavobacteriales bacterium]|jgi:hypothetical protein|nr:glycosyltransferase family 39 protein [Flavobacteriales bacterium]MBK7100408.1 glycosyltransferase family 39 protein [Flavobacteriales bacterium]MBK7617955.1 glycosyltransferase family 39 protein [Flavobacteriales bacterium]MBK8533572.1 glycosyltransferase family 39 protein [Flavobacteriales bacterium]MBK8706935.1 glycosyltransferase family 39 protein [Flavobacteriales bacterium]